MAICQPMLFAVNLLHVLTPSPFIFMKTAGLEYWSRSCLASVITSPVNGATPPLPCLIAYKEISSILLPLSLEEMGLADHKNFRLGGSMACTSLRWIML